MAQNERLEVELQLNTSPVTDSLRRLNRSLGNVSSSGQSSFQSLQLSTIAFGTALGNTITQAVGKFRELASSISRTGIEFNAMQETSEMAWTTILGSAEKAKQMMKDITVLAKDTQFDTGNVDMMAKYLTNAGVEGKALFDELVKVADVSGAYALSGPVATELVRQMSQVRQATVAYTQDLNILQDKGIPIYTALSETLGVSVAEVRELAGEGKISADIFNSAFDRIAQKVQGSAELQAQTFTGMLDTMKDEAQILFGHLSKPAFEGIKNVMPIVLKGFEKLNDTLERDGIRKVLANLIPKSVANTVKTVIGSITSSINSLYTAIYNNAPKIKEGFKSLFNGVKSVVVPILDVLKNSFQTFIPLVADIFSKLGSVLGNVLQALSPVLVGIISFFDTLREAILKGLSKAIDYAIPIIEQLMNAFKQINLSSIIQNIVNTVMTLGSILGEIAGKVMEIVAKLLPLFSSIGQGIMEIIGAVVSFWNEHGLSIIQTIGNIFSGLLDLISNIYTQIEPYLLLLVDVIVGAFTKIKTFWDENGELILSAVENVFNGIKEIIEFVMPAVLTIIDFVMNQIVPIVEIGLDIILKAVKFFAQLFTGDWEGLKETVIQISEQMSELLTTLFTNTFNTIIKLVGWLAENFVRFFVWLGEKSAEAIIWLITETVKNISNFVKDTINKISNFVSNFVGFFEMLFTEGTKIIKDLVKTILTDIGSLPEKLKEIGVNIVSGFIKGIEDNFDWVLEKIDWLFSLIPDWIKSIFGIDNDVSALMRDEVGKPISKGIAEGIDNNSKVLEEASKRMGDDVASGISSKQKDTDKASSDLVSSMRGIFGKGFDDILGQSGSMVDGIIRNLGIGHSEIAKMGGSLGAVMGAISPKETAKKEKNKNKQRSAIDDFRNWLKGFNDEEEKAANKSRDIAYNLDAKLKETEEQRKKRLEKEVKDREKANNERFNKEKKTIEHLEKLDKLSLTDKLKAFQKYMSGWKKGSQQQLYYEEQIYQTKKQIHEQIKNLSDDYLEQVKSINKKLIDDEKALRNEYKQTYDDRVSQLKNFAGLFDSFNGNDMTNVDFVDNMKQQVDAMTGWVNNLKELENRGIDPALIEEIRALGVQSANEVKLMTNMSETELKEFERLWKEKTRLANEQATYELKDAKERMTNQIKELNKNAETELNKLKKQFDKDLKEIRVGSENEFKTLNGSLKTIGKDAMQGLIDGMKAMDGKLKEKALQSAKTIRDTFTKALDIHSPSRLMKNLVGKNIILGIAEGLKDNINTVKNAIFQTVDAMKQPIENIKVALNPIEDNKTRKQMIELFRKYDDLRSLTLKENGEIDFALTDGAKQSFSFLKDIVKLTKNRDLEIDTKLSNLKKVSDAVGLPLYDSIKNMLVDVESKTKQQESSKYNQPIIQVKVVGKDLEQSGLVEKIETKIAGNLNNIVGGRII